MPTSLPETRPALLRCRGAPPLAPNGRASHNLLAASPPNGAMSNVHSFKVKQRLVAFSFSLLGGSVRAGSLTYPLVLPSCSH